MFYLSAVIERQYHRDCDAFVMITKLKISINSFAHSRGAP